MKKYHLYMMAFLAAAFVFAACGDDEGDDDVLEAWKRANEQAFNAIKGNPEYHELKSLGNEGSIYYKVLRRGTGTTPIYYTSTVKCYYKGWFAADYAKAGIKQGMMFDSWQFEDGAPYKVVYLGGTFSLKGELLGVIAGWKTALQCMVEGDKWEIWIPYQLGYGVDGSGSIPPYSTLVFEIEVVEVD